MVTLCNTARQILLMERKSAETGSKTLILVPNTRKAAENVKLFYNKIINN